MNATDLSWLTREENVLAGLLALLITAVFLGFITPTAEAQALPPLGLYISGPQELLADSDVALRIVVTDYAARRPAAGALVSVRWAKPDAPTSVSLVEGRADAQGRFSARFHVPATAAGDYELQIRARYGNLEEQARQRVHVRVAHQLLLTTDKPLYKPGQIIHMRALVLRRPSRHALSDASLTFEISDPRGNKLFKQATRTNAYGIAFADFQLADEINLGEYRVAAILGDERVEKTVTIKRYVLPKFKVVITPDKAFYLPGEIVRGTVQADYFFGKPVTEGKVQLTVKTFDVAFREIAVLTGQTGARGSWKFELRLPNEFVGQPLEQGNAFLQFEAAVTDQAEHTERAVVSSRVAAQPLVIHAVPESGRLVPGVENIVYVLVTRPNGEPVKAKLRYRTLKESPLKVVILSPPELTTDALGIAELHVRPQASTQMPAAPVRPLVAPRRPGIGGLPPWLAAGNEEETQAFWPLLLSASSADGARADTQAELPIGPGGPDTALLLRTNKALAHVGETLEAVAYAAGGPGAVYFDVIKERQTLLTLAAELENGRARVEIPLTEELGGSLWISTYRLTRRGETIRAIRPVFVEPAKDLKIHIQPDKETYRPGPDNVARIAFAVTDAAGRPTPAALGVAVVDESLFAIQEMQPGLEKIYFYLEQELAQPRYEIHGVDWPTLLDVAPKPAPTPLENETLKQEAARVLFASVTPPQLAIFSADTYQERLAAAREQWARQLAPIARKIQQAIERYNEKQPAAHRLRPQDGLTPLLQAGMLQPADLVDPWGTPFGVKPFNPEGRYLWAVILWSYGPDKQKDTEDDLYVCTAQPDMAFASAEEAAQIFRRSFLKTLAGGAIPEAAAPAAMAAGGVAPAPPAAEGAAATQPVRIRQFFPETLFYEPALITDEHGRATLNVPMADSITSWRLTTLANTTGGALGSTTAALRCFQDFFIDIDLPVALTQGDRVSIPVAVYNYLAQPQRVRLQLTKADWFELTGPDRHELEIGPNDVDVRYFTITARKLGMGKLLVHAYGSRMSDAIERAVDVEPNGKLMEDSRSGRLSPGAPIEQTINIPAEAIPEASQILVKIYPGIFSQIVEGLDSLLRMPFGCFEQTSSVTYPNVLVLDYMKSVGRITPELRMKAEGFINLGYQRLVSFEVKGGGFSWFGDAPANKILTAYGLMEFFDMARVWNVDPALLARTQEWLLAQQEPEGFWKPDEQYLHQEAWARIQHNQLPPTAYINWALAYTGCRDERVRKADGWLRQHAEEAEDPYVLAMLANALVQADLTLGAGEPTSETNRVLERLIAKAKRVNGQMYWESAMTGITHSSGHNADLEATGMAALALIAADRVADAAEVLNYLVAQKDPNGTWHSTQATTLALRALLAGQKGTPGRVNAEVAIEINGQRVETFRLTPDTADVLRQIDARAIVRTGANRVRIMFEGEGSSLYQIVGKYYLPWDKIPAAPGEALDIQIQYDRTTLSKDDIVTANVTVTNRLPATTSMIIVDLGVPPGFDVLAEDLDDLVEKGTVQKYSLTGRQIICYIEKLTPRQILKFSYRLRSKYPIRAQTPKSRVYEYYNTDRWAEAPPVQLLVN